MPELRFHSLLMPTMFTVPALKDLIVKWWLRHKQISTMMDLIKCNLHSIITCKWSNASGRLKKACIEEVNFETMSVRQTVIESTKD